MSRTDTPQRIRGTQDLFGEDARRHRKVVETFERVRGLYGFQPVEIPIFEATVRLRAVDRRDHRRRLEGDVFVRGSQRRFGDAAPRIHRRPGARLSRQWLAAICAAQAFDARPGVPLRAAAEGALPPVPPDRRRGDRRGRTRRRRRAAGDGGPAAARTRRLGRGDAQAQHAGRQRNARRVAAGAGGATSRRIAAISPRTA